jgi:hypothetical protein
MKTTWNIKNVLLLGAVLSSLGIAMSQAQCYELTGNLCYQQCGISNACYSIASEYSGGQFSNWTFGPVPCGVTPSGQFCTAKGLFIDFCSGIDVGPCEDDSSLDSRVARLQQAVPGAPIFAASCDGGLSRADIPRQQRNTDGGRDSFERVLQRINRGEPLSASMKGAQR